MAQTATWAPSSAAPSTQTMSDRFGYPDTSLAPDLKSADTVQKTSTPQEAPAERERNEEMFPHAKRAWFSYYRAHRNQVVCASVGLLLAAGFLTIGFWPTLLLAVFISAGVLYGRYKDGDRRTAATVKSIIDRLD